MFCSLAFLFASWFYMYLGLSSVGTMWLSSLLEGRKGYEGTLEQQQRTGVKGRDGVGEGLWVNLLYLGFFV